MRIGYFLQMIKRPLLVFSLFLFSLLFLYGSIFFTASPLSSPFVLFAEETREDVSEDIIDYVLPYPGKIHPDSPIWFLKAARDKIWLVFTKSGVKKSERNLLFADKRLGSSMVLFARGKPELGSSTLEKSGKYLEKSFEEESKLRKEGVDTSSLLLIIAKASLKHRSEIESVIFDLSPADTKPEVVKSLDYSKRVYNDARDALLEKGIEPPNNPFNE